MTLENESLRSKKRAVIITVYIVLFLLLCFFVYLLVKPAPTCFDGRQNQNETGVDCGGVCGACYVEPDASDLILSESLVVRSGATGYEGYFRVINPNVKYGTPEARYVVEYFDQSGNVLERLERETFLLPGQEKDVVLPLFDSQEFVTSMSVEFVDVEWISFDSVVIPELNVSRKNFKVVSGGTNFARVSGLVSNDSSFDFDTITVTVVLRDVNAKPVALHKTEMNTVNASEQRDFDLLWPNRFDGEVARIDVQAHADVYNSQNFIRQYLPGSDTQRF